jgi:APA family basic amino acid/polyamine antiporter
VLPEALGRVHPRFGTPHVATIAAFLCTVAGLFLPSSLLFLLLAVNVPTMLKYFGSCLAAYNVAARRPDVHAQARFRLSRPTVRVLAGLGMLTALVIGALGFSTDWRPYLMLLLWLALGMGYYAVRVRGRTAAPAIPAHETAPP